jgi:hypothetical protein
MTLWPDIETHNERRNWAADPLGAKIVFFFILGFIQNEKKS